MEQSSMLFQKDGKNYLQLDCENAKELSMKLGEKTYPFTKDGKNVVWQDCPWVLYRQQELYAITQICLAKSESSPVF